MFAFHVSHIQSLSRSIMKEKRYEILSDFMESTSFMSQTKGNQEQISIMELPIAKWNCNRALPISRFQEPIMEEINFIPFKRHSEIWRERLTWYMTAQVLAE